MGPSEGLFSLSSSQVVGPNSSSLTSPMFDSLAHAHSISQILCKINEKKLFAQQFCFLTQIPRKSWHPQNSVPTVMGLKLLGGLLFLGFEKHCCSKWLQPMSQSPCFLLAISLSLSSISLFIQMVHPLVFQRFHARQ